MVLRGYGALVKPILGMDEPLKKKCRLEVESAVDTELELLQEHLLQNCLCALPEDTLQTLFWWFHSTDDLWSDVTVDWNRDRVLMLVTCMQLICELTIKQYGQGRVCPRLAEIRDALTQTEAKVIDFLIELADYPDSFVLFAASRALTSFFAIMDAQVDQRGLDKLTDILEEGARPCKMSFSLEILKRLRKWSRFDRHPLEDSPPEDKRSPPTCHPLSVPREEFCCAEVKCLCVKSLVPKWPSIVTRFDNLIRTDCKRYQSSVIAFLNLWQAIVAVKSNISPVELEPFKINLNCYVSLLSSNTPAIVWKPILDLFNEFLCYGTTLALQEELDEKACELAHVIVRGVKDRQLLNAVPYKESGDGFGGSGNEGDKVLLMKMVLLILKAVAVTVKETRYDSSSDSSVGSEVEDADADMAVIERSIRDVIKKLDNFIKAHVYFHPEARLAEWLVQLCTDQDDYLVESMVCCLDVAVGLCYRNNALPDLRRDLNPSVTFLQFLQVVAFDWKPLLDLLTSNETCFLLYLMRVLKYILRYFDEFLYTCGERKIRDVRSFLNGLKRSIERFVSMNWITYNITPVVRLLVKCEELFATLNL